jgi:hypothetical protein
MHILHIIHAGVTHHKIYFSFDELSMTFTSYFKYFLAHKLHLQPSNREVKATINTHTHTHTHTISYLTNPFIIPHSTVWLLISLTGGMQIWFETVTLQILIFSMLTCWNLLY